MSTSLTSKRIVLHVFFLFVGVSFVWWGYGSECDAIYGRDRFAPWWFGGILLIFGGMVLGVAVHEIIVVRWRKNGENS